MKRIVIALLTIAYLAALCACAAQPEVGMRSDSRAGTDRSPYRTIPSVIQCDDCSY